MCGKKVHLSIQMARLLVVPERSIFPFFLGTWSYQQETTFPILTCSKILPMTNFLLLDTVLCAVSGLTDLKENCLHWFFSLSSSCGTQMWQQSSSDHADEDNILTDDSAMTCMQARALNYLTEPSLHINLDCLLQDCYMREK